MDGSGGIKMNKINNLILKTTGLCLMKPHPKHSIRFAKKYFKNKELNGIEIGTFKGENAKHILNNLNINKLYLIDPWKENNEYKESKGQKSLNIAYNKTKKRLKNYKDKTIYLKDYSSNVINKVPEVDYIYIDGNHAYKYVLEDCENYWTKVKKGGILAGHDISLKTTLNAVQDFCKKNDLHFQVAGQDWWIIKEVKNE